MWPNAKQGNHITQKEYKNTVGIVLCNWKENAVPMYDEAIETRSDEEDSVSNKKCCSILPCKSRVWYWNITFKVPHLHLKYSKEIKRHSLSVTYKEKIHKSSPWSHYLSRDTSQLYDKVSFLSKWKDRGTCMFSSTYTHSIT